MDACLPAHDPVGPHALLLIDADTDASTMRKAGIRASVFRPETVADAVEVHVGAMPNAYVHISTLGSTQMWDPNCTSAKFEAKIQWGS